MPADVTQPSFVIFAASGVVPSGASTVAWRYTLSYSTYALVIDRGDGAPTTTWIDDTANRSTTSEVRLITCRR